MPVEPVELLKLLIGLTIMTIPGYLWSYLFSAEITQLERILFGFLSGLSVFTIAPFALNLLFHVTLTQTLIWLLYPVYLIPVIILLLLQRYHLPKISWATLKTKTTALLIGILGLSFTMMFLPHLSNGYYLPFHVDEWIHWAYTQAVITQGTITFTNPYTGSGTITSPEIGFYLANAGIHWISTSDLATVFLFMPALIGVLLSLTAFLIGQRAPRPFGLEAAFLVAFIPTTVRYLGPSFYVPVTLGLLVLLSLIWLIQLKTTQGILLIPVFIFTLFLIHPVIAMVGVGILFLYALFLLIEKAYRPAMLIGVLSVLPILLVVLVLSWWNNFIDRFLQSLTGQEFGLEFNLPQILVSFTDLGLLTWGLLIIGVYFAFTKGKALLRALSIATIATVIIIGLYQKFGYGFPSIYERLFLALFLLVVLIAGFGLAEIRRTLTDLIQAGYLKTLKKRMKNLDILAPTAIAIIILAVAVPAHLSTPYYEMITEHDYEAFTWIHDHLKDYQDANHTYRKAAVDPYKASPFCAVSGLYIASSNMNPLVNLPLSEKMTQFLREKCTNTSFLDKYRLSVIYGDADNTNLTMIHEQVYLYPGLLPGS